MGVSFNIIVCRRLTLFKVRVKTEKLGFRNETCPVSIEVRLYFSAQMSVIFFLVDSAKRSTLVENLKQRDNIGETIVRVDL